MPHVITTEFVQAGRVLLSTTFELALKGRYLGTIGNVQCFDSVRFRDPTDRRCGIDYTTAGFKGSYSVVSRNEAGEIVLIVGVTTSEKLSRVPGAELAR